MKRILKLSRAMRQKEVTESLKERIISGEVDKKMFTKEQLKDIMMGQQIIADHVWHHHQDGDRFQLVPYEIHAQTGHIGGYSLWGINQESKN